MTTPLIVVGYDGSEHAKSALRWSLEEAKLRSAELLVVHGWLSTAVSMDPAGTAIAACEQAGVELLAEAARIAAEQAPDVPVRTQLFACSGAQALLDASPDATLLVLGARGQGGFAGLVLGSVGSQVVHHARCPVMIHRQAA